MTVLQEKIGILPCVDLEKGVDADNKIEGGFFPEAFFEIFDGFNRIGGILSYQFCRRDDEFWVMQCGHDDHAVPVKGVDDFFGLFVGGSGRRYKDNALEIESF